MKLSKYLLFILVLAIIIASIVFIFRYYFIPSPYVVTPSQKTLIVKPMWGLGNRLRTMSGAFTAAKRLNVRCLIFWEKNHHFPQDITELYSNIPIITTIPSDMKIEASGKGKCEWESTLETLENKLPCMISSCSFAINDTDEYRHEFYQWVQLAPMVSWWIGEYSDLLHNTTKKTLGLHLRQGDIADAKDNWFFGQWSGRPGFVHSDSDLACCSDKNSNSPGCPSNIDTIDKRLMDIKNENIDSKTNIWVATDRKNCIEVFEEKLKPASVIHLGSLYLNRRNAKGRDMRKALVDMYMLAKCDHFYGSPISSFTDEVKVINRAFHLS